MNPQRTESRRSVAPWRTLRRWLPAVVAVGLAGPLAAQDKPVPAEPPKTVAPMPVAPPKSEKTYTVSFEGTDWSKVLDWFAKETKLVFLSTEKPTGSLTLKSDEKYTLPELLDLFNEVLAQKNWVIIRREHSFLIHPAADKIPREILHQITLEELTKRGNTEVVQVVIPLKTIVADDIAPQAKKLLSVFGDVTPFGTNQLIIVDKAKNIRNILAFIKEQEGDKSDQFTYAFKHVRASTAAEKLRTLLADKDTKVESNVPMNPWGGGGNPWGGGYDMRGDQGRGGDRNRQPVQEKRFATVQITVDFQNNSIVLTGPANKVVAAQSLVKEIDKGDVARPVGGEQLWKTYDVSAGTAEPLAKQIMDSTDFKGSNVKTLVIGNDKVMIYGYPSDHLDISNFLKLPKTAQAAVEIISVGTADPAKITESLKSQFGSQGLYVEPKADGDAAVLVRGSADLIAAAKEYIKQTTGITGPGSGQSGNFRTLTIEKANAGVLAEEIVRMMNQMGRPAQLVIPGQEKKPEPAPMPKPMTPSPKVGIPGSTQSRYSPTQGVHIVSGQLVDPLQPGPKDDPVVLSVVGNKIFISGKDEKAVALAYELLRLYLNPSAAGEEQYTILRLKFVAAADAAKLINEIFNGPPAGAAGGARPGGGGGGLAAFNPLALLGNLTGGAAPSDPKAGRVRVVADPTSNSLIVVKASQLDMLTINYLLKSSIDDNTPPEGGVAKTWTIDVKNTKASSLVPTIRNVYANKTGRTAARQPQAGFNPFAPQAAAAGPANVALAVDYDDTTNKVVLNCTKTDYEEIKKLVEELDIAAKDSGIVVDVVQLKGGVTPSQIEQTINALAGRAPVQPNQGRGGAGGTQGGFGGGNNPFGGAGGGGNPCGGGGNPFGGFGGGGNPFGGGGGANPFGGGGGRGTGGGTGGGRGAGGGGRQASAENGEGTPHSFNYGDMDVPSAPSVLFDPEVEQSSHINTNDGSALTNAYASVKQRQQPDQLPQVQPGATQPPKLPPVAPPVVPPAVGVPFLSPSSDVQIIPLPELGIVIVRGKNKAEVEAIKALIANIEELTKKSAAINLTVVPLEFGDATQIVFELTQIFSRVQLGTSGTTFPAQQLGFGGVGFQGGGQQNQANRQTIGSILLFPLPRFNAILLGVPESRLEDIKKEIKRLDVPNSNQMEPVPYPLKRATASTVASQIQNFFNQRYPGEALAQNQIRVTYDVASNTVHVQASPADQKDISKLINAFDNSTSKAIAEVKVFRLRNAFSDDLAQVLLQTLTSNALNPQLSASAGLLPTGAGGQGGQQNLLGQGTGAAGGLQQQQGQQRPGALGTLTGTGGTTGLSTKTVSLRFNNVESGLLEDVHLIPDTRINAIIVTAPAATMRLLEALVTELDGVAAAKSFVNIFSLKRADAVAVQALITNLFSRSTTGAQGGGFNQGGTTTQQGTTRPLLTLTGDPAAGASLIDLRVTADQRTNTVIVAGSQNDLDLIRAVITRLEDAQIPNQRSEVLKLSNAASADVVNAINTFLTTTTQQLNTAEFGTTTATFQTLQRQFVLTPEPVTNTILLSASPQFFQQIVDLIRKLDAAPPQVFVQVLIAEVRLNNTEEMGVEIGLQANTLFARGSVGASPGTPGFNFNTTAALPNVNLVNQGQVAFQGLGNLGVGRTSTTGVGAGGFVLSAASDTFSLLIRALKAQGRVDVLSRPQLTLTDNQTGFFQVGQQFPRVTGTTITNGLSQQGVEYIDTGVVLRVTPRISPEGRVLMRVEPSITSPSASNVSLGNGITATPIDTQTVETTVQASDGETVVLGGLIRKSDVKLENKIPWFGDLPWVGAAFRYRTQQTEKRELIFIMTPHIVRSEADMARIVAEEAKKINWSLKDVEAVHGHGTDVLSGRYHNALLPQQQAPYCPPGEVRPNLMNLPFSPTGQVTPGTPGPAPIYNPPAGTPMGAPLPTQGPPPVSSNFPSPPAGFAGPNQLGVPNGAPPVNAIPTPGIQPQSWNAPARGWTFGGTQAGGTTPPSTSKPKEGNQWRVYGR